MFRIVHTSPLLLRRCGSGGLALYHGVRFATKAATDTATATTTTTTTVETTTDTAKTIPIDVEKLPRTIPGVSQEELAALIAEHHRRTSVEKEKVSKEHSEKLAEEVELMKRSMSEEDFKRYVERINKINDENLKEELKMAAMTPVELHWYLQKKKRKQVQQEWLRLIMLIGVFSGTLMSLFAFFVMFYNT